MFEVPKIKDKEIKIYNKVKFALMMEQVQIWAENRNKDLTQDKAEEIAENLFDYCYEDECLYLDEVWGDRV